MKEVVVLNDQPMPVTVGTDTYVVKFAKLFDMDCYQAIAPDGTPCVAKAYPPAEENTGFLGKGAAWGNSVYAMPFHFYVESREDKIKILLSEIAEIKKQNTWAKKREEISALKIDELLKQEMLETLELAEKNPRFLDELHATAIQKDKIKSLVLEIRGVREQNAWDNKIKEIEALDIDVTTRAELIKIVNLAKTNPELDFDSREVRDFILQMSDFYSLSKSKRTAEEYMKLFHVFDNNRNILKINPDHDMIYELYAGVARHINEYTSQEMLTFLKALNKDNQTGIYNGIQNTVIEKLVDGLKDYKDKLFYFNPKRLSVTKLVENIEHKTVELIDAPASLPAALTRKVPKKLLEKFKKSENKFIRYRHYELVKVDNDRFYVIDLKKKLGSGEFGVVYQAYKMNPTTREFGEKFVVKIMTKPKNYTEQQYEASIKHEEKALRENFKVEPPIRHPRSGKTYLISEYIQGCTMGDYDERGYFSLDRSVATLPLAQRMKAFWLLAVDMYRVHQSVVHGDVKPANVNIVIENKEVKDVRLLDYGFGRLLNANNPEELINLENSHGTPWYVASEVVEDKKIGTNSDVYSLVPTILCMLGVSDPLEYRTNATKVLDGFSFRGIFTGMKDKIPLEMQRAIILFLRRMESRNYTDRPSSEKVLEFFHAIKNHFFCENEEEKQMWTQKSLDVVKSYIEYPADKWALFLSLRDKRTQDLSEYGNQAEAAKQLLASLAHEVKPEKIRDQLNVLNYFTDNYVGNEEKWKDVAQNIFTQRAYFTAAEKAFYYSQLSKKPDVALTHDVKLAHFLFLSKRENYIGNEASWRVLARIIANNINNYEGKDMLTFLRKLNKFNEEGRYDDIRNDVVEKLTTLLAKAYGNEAQRQQNSTVKYVEDAIKQDLFLFKSYRTQYRLKKASQTTDEDLSAVVSRLKSAPAA